MLAKDSLTNWTPAVVCLPNGLMMLDVVSTSRWHRSDKSFSIVGFVAAELGCTEEEEA